MTLAADVLLVRQISVGVDGSVTIEASAGGLVRCYVSPHIRRKYAASALAHSSRFGGVASA